MLLDNLQQVVLPMVDLAERLTDLGLSRNEADLYLALLASGEATASEVAKDAGIARPAVYGLLDALVAHGLVESFPVRPQRYRANGPRTALAALVEGRKGRLEEARESVCEELEQLYSAPSAKRTQVWINRDLMPCAGKYAEVLAQAKEDAITLIGWCSRNEAAIIFNALRDAATRGVTLHAYFVHNTIYDDQVPVDDARELARDIPGVRVLSLPASFPMSPPVKLLVVDESDTCIVAGDFDEEHLTEVLSVHYRHLSTINRIVRRVHANLHKLPFAKIWGL